MSRAEDTAAGGWLARLAPLGPYALMLVVLAGFSLWIYLQEGQRGLSFFFSLRNVQLIAVHAMIVAAVAVGMTLLMISGGIDLSVGFVVSLVTVTTVLASRGYPDAPEKGAAIAIPSALPAGVTVFHAGTARGADGALRVSGGRVLNVTAVAPTFTEAQRLSRETAESIEFEGKIFRRDIGWREAARRPARAVS